LERIQLLKLEKNQLAKLPKIIIFLHQE
jgi:hypothetical protein